jgi:hypothetical protein
MKKDELQTMTHEQLSEQLKSTSWNFQQGCSLHDI